MQFHAFGADQRLVELLIFLLIKGAVDIIRLTPVITGGKVHAVHIDGIAGDDRGGSIVEAEVAFPAKPADGIGQRLGGKRAGGNDDLPLRQLGHFPVDDGHVRQRADLAGHGVGEGCTVHCQRPAGADRRFFGAADDQGIPRCHFRLQQAGR